MKRWSSVVLQVVVARTVLELRYTYTTTQEHRSALTFITCERTSSAQLSGNEEGYHCQSIAVKSVKRRGPSPYHRRKSTKKPKEEEGSILKRGRQFKVKVTLSAEQWALATAQQTTFPQSACQQTTPKPLAHLPNRSSTTPLSAPKLVGCCCCWCFCCPLQHHQWKNAN